MQRTVAKVVTLSGTGLHSGRPVELVIAPAAVDSGIKFVRSDLSAFSPLPALYSNVGDTRNCTCLSDAAGNVVSTIEHLMAALCVARIDNALISLNSPEMPIMGGGAAEFFAGLQAAGIAEQSAAGRRIRVLRPVEFRDDKGNYAALAPHNDFAVHFTIDFPSPIVGHQEFDHEISAEIFASQIAPCRTYLRSIGLIKGGSLDNAVVLDGDKILNPDGFKVSGECVNHKVLDAIGDMYTAGLPLLGRLTGFRSGHFHNNRLLQVLFADKSNYTIEEY